MKLGLRCLALSIALLAIGCSNGDYSPIIVACDAGDAAPIKELVCGADFCGRMVDKNTGATADCGNCPSGSECGDNGISNVCGAACLPVTNTDVATYGKYNVAACDYSFGQGWGQGYGTEMQFPYACNYPNQATCVPIHVASEPNKPCGATVCGDWWCCVDNVDAGYPALNSGAVANNDGGLP